MFLAAKISQNIKYMNTYCVQLSNIVYSLMENNPTDKMYYSKASFEHGFYLFTTFVQF